MIVTWRGVSRQQKKHLVSSKAVSWVWSAFQWRPLLEDFPGRNWVCKMSKWDSLPVMFFSCLSSPLSLSFFLFLSRSLDFFRLRFHFLFLACALSFSSLSLLPSLSLSCTHHTTPSSPPLSLLQFTAVPFHPFLSHTHTSILKVGNTNKKHTDMSRVIIVKFTQVEDENQQITLMSWWYLMTLEYINFALPPSTHRCPPPLQICKRFGHSH